MYAKKSLGQHFLRSERALSSIIEAGNITPGETVLEIGPGTGALTEKLLDAGAKVIAVEKDDELFAALSKKYPGLELVHGDILNFQTSQLGTYKLIANIPYNITGAILEKFLSANQHPKLMVLLVQKEVAQRMVAGNGKESILSISVKAYGKPRYVETVKAGSFAPAPAVDSAIIAIENISKSFFTNFSEKDFFKLLHAGFQAKRKKLSSNLGVVFAKERVKEAFRKLNMDENLRAEDLPVNKWGELVALLLEN
ncbi:MAG: Ribosomal RNA small subunit methyltransferase A [Parcubacteria group bacterium GW2011_GWA2_50_10b]|nr:MAG: Ribosomal RNA small subunit methyltransferase A [Parcubacteria group bacterium GW2011_GWA2_50_10b]